MKDLETKVEDLQKASESANHENSILRAQIEKMSTEMREYKKRLASNGGSFGQSASSTTGLPPYLAARGLGNGTLNNPNDVNFHFEFPRFGRLPEPAPTNGKVLNVAQSSVSPTTAPQQLRSPSENGQISPRSQSLQYKGSSGSTSGVNQTPALLDGGDMSSLSGLFSPSILESVAKSPPFDFFANGNNSTTNGSRSSTDSANGNMSTGHNTSYSSPSASSNTNQGPSSSCGTSPEPTTQSPVYIKPADPILTTIGEEQTGLSDEGEVTFCDKLNMACGNPNNPVPRTMSDSAANSRNPGNEAFDVNGIDWFAQQNGNQFDPQLFGDYREPQDNILSGEPFNDSFFTEAFALPDFTSPYNVTPSPVPPKKDLVSQLDETQYEDEEVVPGEDRSSLLSCNTIWYVSSKFSRITTNIL